MSSVKFFLDSSNVLNKLSSAGKLSVPSGSACSAAPTAAGSPPTRPGTFAGFILIRRPIRHRKLLIFTEQIVFCCPTLVEDAVKFAVVESSWEPSECTVESGADGDVVNRDEGQTWLPVGLATVGLGRPSLAVDEVFRELVGEIRGIREATSGTRALPQPQYA
ncbi:hypothetical protein NEOLEDRAFT_1133501 [Neolentinus lepideus HHB14362 ss-1]|uniref:Uncharacterized protein n=1 Tax=Neolentinus lepideus HHB14362 ss-1 TaxID=1314782 RepID=A0A165SQQ4_9AGAM|nr:hypothetical protein NEOLEDRAFT_1133501 [Neolentinus lepideus HHB14362 ss-1]